MQLNIMRRGIAVVSILYVLNSVRNKEEEKDAMLSSVCEGMTCIHTQNGRAGRRGEINIPYDNDN